MISNAPLSPETDPNRLLGFLLSKEMSNDLTS